MSTEDRGERGTSPLTLFIVQGTISREVHSPVWARDETEAVQKFLAGVVTEDFECEIVARQVGSVHHAEE